MKRNLKKLSTVFSRTVHEYSIAHSITLLESAIIQAGEFGIELEHVPKYLTKELIQRLTVEVSNLKLLKRENRHQENLNVFFAQL